MSARTNASHKERRGKLLFLSHRVPFPVHNGQSARTYNLLRELSREYEIVALCFDNVDPSRPDIPMQERRDALAPLVSELHVFPLPQDASRARFVRDHAASVVRRRPYTYTMYESRPYLDALHAALKKHEFALAHFESMDLIRYLDEVAPLPIACTHHNVESELLFRRAESETGARRSYIRHQAELLLDAERKFLARLELNVAVSANDRAAFLRIAPDANVVMVPNGVDVDYFLPRRNANNNGGCAFVGGTNWYPNKEGLEWYVAEIAPELQRIAGPVETRWIGYCRDDERKQFSGRSGVVLTGFVNDLRDDVTAASCFVVPLRVGGGTRLKVLEAWSLGSAVVSTSLGCEGLDARHEENILLADSAAEFAQQTARVLSDAHLRTRLGAAARETAVGSYSWQSLGEQLARHYRAVERTHAR